MKRIIDGHRYDTEAAKEIAFTQDGSKGDFQFCRETLYRTKSGRYFIFGVGGPDTKYAEEIGQNQWSGGSKIIPVDDDAAQKFAEEHLDADEVEELFGEHDADTVKVSADISAADKQRLDDIKAAADKSLGELLSGWIRKDAVKRLYFVLDDAADGQPAAAWDTFLGVYETEDQAITEAENDWNHLTKSEKAKRIVTVNWIYVQENAEISAETYEKMAPTEWYTAKEYKA